jgi:hypothetical protein
MNRTWLAFISMLAGCTGGNVSGSYNGTLTITTTTGNVVVTTLANIHPEEIAVELSSNGAGANVTCDVQGMSVSGTSLHFDCATHQCGCSMDAADLTITAASGSVVNDVLTVDFSGEGTGGSAYSATFMGMLEPGTR